MADAAGVSVRMTLAEFPPFAMACANQELLTPARKKSPARRAITLTPRFVAASSSISSISSRTLPFRVWGVRGVLSSTSSGEAFEKT